MNKRQNIIVLTNAAELIKGSKGDRVEVGQRGSHTV